MTRSDDTRYDRQLQLEDIPNIDLYMDQVIQLFERTFEDTTRSADETILTKTMINNYAKKKLFFPVTNKKYTKEHLILISLIYQLKSSFSINDIKTILTPLNEGIEQDQLNLEDLYRNYLALTERNADRFTVDQEALAVSTTNPLEQILALAHMSNLYRRAAEQLIDTQLKK